MHITSSFCTIGTQYPQYIDSWNKPPISGRGLLLLIQQVFWTICLLGSGKNILLRVVTAKKMSLSFPRLACSNSNMCNSSLYLLFWGLQHVAIVMPSSAVYIHVSLTINWSCHLTFLTIRNGLLSFAFDVNICILYCTNITSSFLNLLDCDWFSDTLTNKHSFWLR